MLGTTSGMVAVFAWQNWKNSNVFVFFGRYIRFLGEFKDLPLVRLGDLQPVSCCPLVLFFEGFYLNNPPVFAGFKQPQNRQKHAKYHCHVAMLP